MQIYMNAYPEVFDLFVKRLITPNKSVIKSRIAYFPYLNLEPQYLQISYSLLHMGNRKISGE